MSKATIVNKEKYKILFNKINQIYKANESDCIFNIQLTKDEKELLIRASKKHIKDYDKIYNNTKDWKGFITGIIEKIKNSKESIKFIDYEFIKIRIWLCDLKY